MSKSQIMADVAKAQGLEVVDLPLVTDVTMADVLGVPTFAHGEPKESKSQLHAEMLVLLHDAAEDASPKSSPALSEEMAKMVNLCTDPVINETLAEPVVKTHKLVATYKARNGKRQTQDFPLTSEQANDPALRASAISSASAYGDGRGWRLVNWDLKQVVFLD